MEQLKIKTAQNINIDFALADVGHRLGAFFIDNILKFIYLYFVFTVLESYTTHDWRFDHWSKAAFYIVLSLPVVLYSLYSEVLMDGQTIGKKLLKIKIISIDGFKPDFTDHLIRWFLRMIDFNFFSLVWVYIYSFDLGDGALFGIVYAAFLLGKMIGFFLIIRTKNNQRLGDIIANTTVIKLKDEVQFSETIIEDLVTDYKPTYPNVINLSDNDMRIIKDTFTNIDTGELNTSTDFKTLIKLRSKIEEVAGIKSQEKTDYEFISKVLKDYSFYTQDL